MKDILAVLDSRLANLLKDTALLWMFASAQVNTVPEDLPPSIKAAFGWLWKWQVHALRLFFSIRSGNGQVTEVAQKTEVTKSISVKTEDQPNG